MISLFPLFPQFLPFSLIDLSRVFPDQFRGNCCSHKHTLSHYHHGVGGPGRDADRRKKTGCRRRNVIKEHLDAEDRKTDWLEAASSCSGPVPALPVLLHHRIRETDSGREDWWRRSQEDYKVAAYVSCHLCPK